MKRGFLLFVFLLSVFAVAASLPDKRIVIKSAEGSAEYALKNIKSLKLKDGMFTFNLCDGSSESWSAAYLNSMTFDEYDPSQETGIGDRVAGTFTMGEGVLEIETAASVPVALLSVDGKVLLSTISDGTFSLRMNDYPKGVYMLSINGVVYKIMNR